MGQNPRILRSDKHPSDFFTQLWDTIKKGKVWKGEILNRKKSGELFWSLATISPIKGNDGNIVSFLAIEEDLTETKRIAKELTDSQNVTEGIVNTIREPLLVLDKNLKVVIANPAFYRTFQVTAQQTIGSLLFDLGNRQWNIPELKKLLEEIIPSQTTIEGFRVEHDFLTIGSRVMLLNARQLPKDEGQEKLILLAFQDVTQPQGKLISNRS